METTDYSIATTQEQSKRLLQCGVSEQSSDMMYLDDGELTTLSYEEYNREFYHDQTVPAWSLSRLLVLLPKIVESHSFLPETYALLLMPKDNASLVCYANKKLQYMVYVAQPIIEACVQVIEWLVVHGYKLNEV